MRKEVADPKEETWETWQADWVVAGGYVKGRVLHHRPSTHDTLVRSTKKDLEESLVVMKDLMTNTATKEDKWADIAWGYMRLKACEDSIALDKEEECKKED